MSTCCTELPCIFKWTDLKQTGLIALGVNGLLISMLASHLSVLYITLNFALLITLGTTIYLFAQGMITGASAQADESAAQEHVSEETVQRIVIGLVNLYNCSKAYFTELHKSVPRQLKVIVGLYLAAKVVGCLSVPLLSLLAFDVTLVYGFVTRVLGIDVCALAQPHVEKVKGLVQLGLSMIPKYAPAESK